VGDFRVCDDDIVILVNDAMRNARFLLRENEVLGFLVTTFVDGGKFELAKRLVIDYDELVISCLVINRLLSALNMISRGIRPNTITFNVIIDGFGKSSNINSLLNMYEKMLEFGCRPDVITFTSILDGYCRIGDLHKGLEIWDEMNRRNLYPNIYTFSILINTLCKEGRFIEARDLLRQLKQRGDIVPKAFIYNPVIDGFCKAGNVDEANLIVTEMEENRCKPDKLTFTILIIGHCAKGRMVEAISLFDKMMIVEVAFRPSSVIGGMHRRTHQVISQMPYFRLSSVGSHISVFPSDAEGSLNKSKLHKSSLMFGQIACFVPNVTKVQGSSLWETFGTILAPKFPHRDDPCTFIMFGMKHAIWPNKKDDLCNLLFKLWATCINRSVILTLAVESERASSLVCFPGEMVDAVSNYSIYQDIVLSDDLVLDGNQYIFLN
nr:hypothetical protein [Tanacetum cinerariifolium]